MDGILTLNDAESFVDDSLEARFWQGKFSISVENPWAGSTETGFGYTCNVDLTDDQARQLADFILSKLAAKADTPTI